MLELFPETTTNSIGKALGRTIEKKNKQGNAYGKYESHIYKQDMASKGSAARFFYCAKASKKDRNEGLPTMSENHESSEKVGNTHPTVKPTALMAYLCRLITPTGGVVLDPYMGSGSTGKAAVREGFSFVGCELDKDYFDIATARVNNEDD